MKQSIFNYKYIANVVSKKFTDKIVYLNLQLFQVVLSNNFKVASIKMNICYESTHLHTKYIVSFS